MSSVSIIKLFTTPEGLFNKGILVFELIISTFLSLSIIALSSLSVSSPSMPSNDCSSGRTKNVISKSQPMSAKNLPEILFLINICPAGLLIKKDLFTGWDTGTRSDLIKFLFAPVSTRKCNVFPSCVPYSMYGTLETRLLS